jgi:hypothetical protein
MGERSGHDFAVKAEVHMRRAPNQPVVAPASVPVDAGKAMLSQLEYQQVKLAFRARRTDPDAAAIRFAYASAGVLHAAEARQPGRDGEPMVITW